MRIALPENRRRRRLVILAIAAAIAGVYYLISRVFPHDELQGLLEDISNALGAWTYLLVGVFAFAETGAFVGLVVPGETTMLLGGAVAGQGAINVFKPSPEVRDPVADELERLDIQLRPAAGPNALSVTRGLSVPLSQSLRQTTGQVSGRFVRQRLETVIASPEYQQANDVVRQRLLARAIADARSAVNEQALRAAVSERLSRASAR